MIAPTTPPAPSLPLPRIYEDVSGISAAEYIPPPPQCHSGISPYPPFMRMGLGYPMQSTYCPPPMPFRYMEHANYHAYLPKLRLAGHIPLPPLPPDRDRCGAVVHETPVDVRCSAVVPHRDAIEVRAFRPSEGLPRAQATVPSRFISDRSQVTEPVFLTNGRRRTDERHHRPKYNQSVPIMPREHKGDNISKGLSLFAKLSDTCLRNYKIFNK
ncbi:hypothetical protein BU17DRAFT_70968 [Hysterangium stoloniferum]|nr:hypothetical protein BU17DRAFT_70968 [Hysterangium stoloniferum]